MELKTSVRTHIVESTTLQSSARAAKFFSRKQVAKSTKVRDQNSASRGPIFASGEDCRYTENLTKAA